MFPLLLWWCSLQIRVYPLDAIRNDDYDPEPLEAAFIHRLPSKMSSIAWSPFDEVRNPLWFDLIGNLRYTLTCCDLRYAVVIWN